MTHTCTLLDLLCIFGSRNISNVIAVAPYIMYRVAGAQMDADHEYFAAVLLEYIVWKKLVYVDHPFLKRHFDGLS